jgi:hypothetical protein
VAFAIGRPAVDRVFTLVPEAVDLDCQLDVSAVDCAYPEVIVERSVERAVVFEEDIGIV